MASAPKLKVGDDVDVPWGLDTFRGIVLEVYSTGAVQRARVRIDVPGTDEPQVITLPVSDLLAESEHAGFSQPGSWMRFPEYERAVQNALVAAASNLPSPEQLRLHSDFQEHDNGFDFILQAPRKLVVVAINWQLREFKNYTAKLTRALTSLEHSADRPAVGLIISPNAPRAIVSEVPFGPFLVNHNLLFVRWQGANDDERLLRAIERALA